MSVCCVRRSRLSALPQTYKAFRSLTPEANLAEVLQVPPLPPDSCIHALPILSPPPPPYAPQVVCAAEEFADCRIRLGEKGVRRPLPPPQRLWLYGIRHTGCGTYSGKGGFLPPLGASSPLAQAPMGALRVVPLHKSSDCPRLGGGGGVRVRQFSSGEGG